MKSRGFVALALALCLLLAPQRSEGLTFEKYEPGFSIAQVVDDSEIVVLGKIVERQFVYRPETDAGFTTDITIKVEEFIKGEANAGRDRVKFMIDGGTDDRPTTPEDERSIVTVPGQPEYPLNERILLFLQKIDEPGVNIAHGGLMAFHYVYGKRKVENDKVTLWYTLGDDTDEKTKLPVDLAVKMSKAAKKDKAALAGLENRVRAQIVIGLTADGSLPASLVNTLGRDAQDILDRD